MRDWHNNWKTDIGLRLCGLTSCGVSYLAIRMLMALRLPDSQLPQTALPFLFAAIGFLCASTGAGLLFLGHHIFDQVEISQRWWITFPPGDDIMRSDIKADFKADEASQSSRSVSNQDTTRAFDSIPRT